jgi:hypothetical protein
MTDESTEQVIELPDRKEISLCEAVTAVIYGRALTANEYYQLVEEPQSKDDTSFEIREGRLVWVEKAPADERTSVAEEKPAYKRIAKSEPLLAGLREAAYAGRIQIRAKRGGEDDFQYIDPLYYQYMPKFNWWHDEILRDDESSPTWHFVHLDREQFVTFLQKMGISVQGSAASPAQSKDTEAPPKQKTYKTGDPGRPTSRHIYMQEAERRLAAEDYPKTLKEFADELAEWLQNTHPQAAPVTPGTIRNRVRRVWRAHEKACTKTNDHT